MLVVVSPRAERDLEQIAEEREWRDRKAAFRVLKRIEGQISVLANYPELGRLRDEVAPGIRSLSAAPFVVLYRIANGRVEVLRCIDGRRNSEKWL